MRTHPHTSTPNLRRKLFEHFQGVQTLRHLSFSARRRNVPISRNTSPSFCGCFVTFTSPCKMRKVEQSLKRNTWRELSGLYLARRRWNKVATRSTCVPPWWIVNYLLSLQWSYLWETCENSPSPRRQKSGKCGNSDKTQIFSFLVNPFQFPSHWEPQSPARQIHPVLEGEEPA